MKRLSTSALFLCGAIFAAHSAFGQVSTTLTVAKAQDFKQTGTAAPVQVTNPFSLSLSAQAQGYTIASATVAPPAGAVINLTSASTTLFTFVSAPVATAAALDTTFPNGPYNFTVNPPAGAGAPVTGTVTPGATPYPAAPTLTNSEWQGTTGTLQFDPTIDFTVSWTAASAATITDGLLTISDPFGAQVFSKTITTSVFNTTIPANTLKAGTIYSARLSFGRTNTTRNSTGTVTMRWSYISATNFTLAPVTGIPKLISPNSVTTIVNQPAGYQLITNTRSQFSIGNSTPLPPGLKFDPVSGIVYGTPTAAGSPSPDYQIQNAAGVNGGVINLNDQPPPTGPTFVNATTATGHTNSAFRFPIVTNGASPSATFSATGLPAGLTIDATSGVISGTVANQISAAVTVTITDGSFTRSCTLQLSFIADPILPIITSVRRVTLAPGQPFSYQITADYGKNRADEPSFNVLGGLPPGLSFDPKTGVIAGTFTGAAERNGAPPDRRALNDTPPVQLVSTNTHGSGTAPLTFFTAPTGTVNLSTRMFVGVGQEVLIGGFIITGTGSENILLRGIGPSLPVGNALQDPVLELHDKSGAIISTNENWQDDATQAQAIQATGVAPTDPRESAIVATFAPSNYTAIVSGKNFISGTGLVELFDLGSETRDTAHGTLSAQISTRGTVRAGDDVMIGGFIIQSVATKALLRGIGPELTAQGVAGALQDPLLELHDGNGTLLTMNDDWQEDSEQAQEIEATGVAPTDPRESALIATLNPGNYTAVLRGFEDTTGVALVEVYNLQ